MTTFLAGWPGDPPGPEVDPVPQPHEQRLLGLDTTRARKILGWRPLLDTGQAVDWTRKGYMDWAGQGENFDAQTLCRHQINSYMHRLTHG